jgi:hypothetical protein
MAKAAAERIEKELRSRFTKGSIAQVQVLEYGDEPEVEPGEVGIRILLSRSGRPEGEQANKEIIDAFDEANKEQMKELREHLPRFIGWVEFRVESAESADSEAKARGPVRKMMFGGPSNRAKTLDEMSDGLTPVMTRLGTADLATVDMLIAAGFANSRAEVLRWAIGRIREHPAYTDLQNRMQDIDALKAQF